jgi:hypothetical protein
MRFVALIVSLTLSALDVIAQPLSPRDPLRTPTPQQAYEQLLTVSHFVFGGGFYPDGGPSEGERAYRAIAAGTNATGLFSAALTNGNAQAKLYALCGIRQFAPGMFDSYARALRIANPLVDTTFGDRIRREFATNLVTRISSGRYDVYLRNTKP